MGSASCKNPKAPEQTKDKVEEAKIIIGVFGLHDAGKTSTVKTIEGAPTTDVEPTISSETTKVPYPTTNKSDKKSQDRVTIIDVSGSKRFREKSWPEYYRKIHGLIYVLDASDKRSFTENRFVLEDLLEHDDLKDKPILILANKQDCRGAIDTEKEIKDKLHIEELRRKHKIEFCSAIPDDKKKPDTSIRQGFSWLIRAIEQDYTKINSRVNNTENSSRPPKPMERKFQRNIRQQNNSDQSDADDGIVYPRRRSTSPSTTKKSTDYRQMTNSIKLSPLDLNKTKSKKSGNQTYSESDHDDDRSIHSRPNVSRPTIDTDHRDQTTTSSTGGFNKKKKLIGTSTGNHANDQLMKKIDDNQPKSFRSSYEPFPEDSPWTTSGKKPTKPDDYSAKLFNKPLGSSDFNKRNTSPLVHDTKPYGNSTISRRDKGSGDEDDDFNEKQKPKSTLPYTNKPSTTNKKSLSSKYGDDEDDEYLKNNNLNHRLNLTPPIIPKKPAKSDDDYGHSKKMATKPTTNFGSDDESKNKDTFTKPYERPIDRYYPLNEYRGITGKPPASPSLKSSQPKLDDYRPLSSSVTKPSDRLKLNNDYTLGYTKTPTGLRFSKDDDDDDRFSSTLKTNAPPKYGDINRAPSPLRLNTTSKYDNDNSSPVVSKLPDRLNNNNSSSTGLRSNFRSQHLDDDDDGSGSKSTPKKKLDDDDDDDNIRSSWKPTTYSSFKDAGRSSSPPYKTSSRSKLDDDDDDLYKSSSSKPTPKTKFGDDDDRTSSTKPTIRSTFKDNGRSSSPYGKPVTRSKYDNDDDDLPSSTKPTTRSTLKDSGRSSPPYNKSTARSKYDDDDDDDEKRPSLTKRTTGSKFEDDDDDLSSSRKPTTRSPFNDSGRSSPLHSKPMTRSKYDNDDKGPSPTKRTTGSNFDDDDDHPSSIKPGTRSMYKDSSRSPPSYNKSTARSKYNDDDDDDDKQPSPSKRTTGSKFEDDDDLPSSTKPETRSMYKDSSRSPQPYSKSNARSRYDDDDDNDRSSSVKRTAASKFEDDDDDFPKTTSKNNNYSSRDTNNNKTGSGRTRFDKDPYDS